jgi:F-type H+-transporting ATPase subunit b
MSLYHLSIISAQVIAAAEGTPEASAGPSIPAMMVTVIVGFLVVYWILKTYAFGPVLDMIDQRTDKIESELKRADDARLQAEADRSEAEERLRNIEEEARVKMQAMMSEARQLADSIQQKAQTSAADLLDKARQNIEFETEKARETIKSDVINLTIVAAEHLIKEKLDDPKQRELIGDFLTRIERN